MSKSWEKEGIPNAVQWDLEKAMRKKWLKKGTGKKAKSLIQQLLELFE